MNNCFNSNLDFFTRSRSNDALSLTAKIPRLFLTDPTLFSLSANWVFLPKVPHRAVLLKSLSPHPLRYVLRQTHTNIYCDVCNLTKFSVSFHRSAGQTRTSLIPWRPRKPASPISAVEGQLHLYPPPLLTAVRTMTAPARNPCFSRPSPQALPPISLFRPTPLHPLTSSPAQLPTPTHPAPRKAAAPRTCLLIRVPPVEIRHPAPSPLIEPCRTSIGTLLQRQDQPPPQAPLEHHSQLPLLSSPVLPCPAVPPKSSKRSPRSTKTRIERRTKGKV